MSEYTPDTDVVRDAYVEGQTDYTMPGHVSQAEHVARFDRWLADVESAAGARALSEYAAMHAAAFKNAAVDAYERGRRDERHDCHLTTQYAEGKTTYAELQRDLRNPNPYRKEEA